MLHKIGAALRSCSNLFYLKKLKAVLQMVARERPPAPPPIPAKLEPPQVKILFAYFLNFPARFFLLIRRKSILSCGAGLRPEAAGLRRW